MPDTGVLQGSIFIYTNYVENAINVFELIIYVYDLGLSCT